MPSDDFVVADTSPLLNLALTGRLDLVRSQFASITVPVAVRRELLAGDDAADQLEKLLASDLVTVAEPRRDDLVRELQHELDVGEAATIALAIERAADLALIDERDGRRVARRHEIPVTGAIGILLKAAHDGEVSIRPALDDLRSVGFWIDDDLYHRAIDAVEADDE